jgi:hypothetical protein
MVGLLSPMLSSLSSKPLAIVYEPSIKQEQSKEHCSMRCSGNNNSQLTSFQFFIPSIRVGLAKLSPCTSGLSIQFSIMGK